MIYLESYEVKILSQMLERNYQDEIMISAKHEIKKSLQGNLYKYRHFPKVRKVFVTKPREVKGYTEKGRHILISKFTYIS